MKKPLKGASGRQVLRTCVACRAVKPKAELLRFFLKGGEIKVDLNKRGAGRGAYICAKIECLNKVQTKKGAFARAFKANLPQKGLCGVYAEISEMLTAGTGSEATDENKLKLQDKRHN